jgi:hypothetical protein
MAHLSNSRRTLTGMCLPLLLGVLVATCGASPAASLELPEISVEVPAVSVKTPAGTVTTPSVSKTPAAATPTAPAKASPVPAKTTPAKTTPVKVPAVKVDAPSISGVPAPATSTPALGKVATPIGGVTTTSSTSVAATPPGRTASSSTEAAGTGGAPGAASGSQGSPVNGVSGYGAAPGAELPVGERGARRSPAERTRIAADKSLTATVARLQGCLSELPEPHRRALMLRSGVGSSQALSPSATAARLHLAAARLARVERQALGELRKAARTRSCGQVSEITTAVAAFVGSSARGGEPGASGGVEAARYSFSPPARHAIKPAPSGESLLGDISPTASSAIVVLLLVVAAVIAAGIVVTRGSGNSPPWRRWRRRVASGLRRAR